MRMGLREAGNTDRTQTVYHQIYAFVSPWWYGYASWGYGMITYGILIVKLLYQHLDSEKRLTFRRCVRFTACSSISQHVYVVVDELPMNRYKTSTSGLWELLKLVAAVQMVMSVVAIVAAAVVVMVSLRETISQHIQLNAQLIAVSEIVYVLKSSLLKNA